MSRDQPSSRKEKKAQRDAERKKSGKKRKRNEGEDATKVDTSAELQHDFIPLVADEDDVQAKKVKKSKPSSKKRKAEELGEDDATADAMAVVSEPAATEPKPKKRKKQKKNEVADGEAVQPVDETSENKSKSRFVCFIGNLPYSTTDASLQAHFKKLLPFTLRHRTDPETKKSKGFAFLEFENYDRMKTCLKLYHHSIFDPTAMKAANVEEDGAEDGKENAKKKPKREARRINVELTAGGGGKNEDRKQKIKVKNERLNEQRQRRAEFERLEREKEKKAEGKAGDAAAKKTKKKQERQQGKQEEEMGGMHPSRMARMQT